MGAIELVGAIGRGAACPAFVSHISEWATIIKGVPDTDGQPAARVVYKVDRFSAFIVQNSLAFTATSFSWPCAYICILITSCCARRVAPSRGEASFCALF